MTKGNAPDSEIDTSESSPFLLEGLPEGSFASALLSQPLELSSEEDPQDTEGLSHRRPAKISESAQQQSLHIGHRERLRHRAEAAGIDKLPDYEILELYLFRTLPRGDVKPRVKMLLARFGSLAEVFGAPERELLQCAGIGQATARDLKLAHEMTVRLARAEVTQKPVVSSWSALISYVRVSLAHERREQFRVLFLDRKNRLICDEILSHGTVDQAAVYPREIMRRALELSASAIILLHNHPSGDPTPSNSDIHMTREVVAAGKPLNITVHDHLIIGRGGVASFKALGLF